MSTGSHKVRSPITTHVLDVHRGRPAAGVNLTLEFQSGKEWKTLATGSTNNDGRAETLLPPESELVRGVYRLTFGTGEYFRGLGKKTFYPWATVVFEVIEPTEHYHVPLLLSGHGFSTYRGS